MNENEIQQALANYGKSCTYEQLVKAGTSEFNGLRYENIIPWSSTTDQWVKKSTRITGSLIGILETQPIRSFTIEAD